MLESDPEDMEDESPCDLPVIVYMGPAPSVPFMETSFSSGPKSFKLATDFLCQDV